MSKAVFKDGRLVYKKLLRSFELPAEKIVWAYLQQEDVNARICCGRTSYEIGRLVVVDGDGQREVFQYEGMDEPSGILEQLQMANSAMAVGYTPENRARFGDL